MNPMVINILILALIAGWILLYRIIKFMDSKLTGHKLGLSQSVSWI